MKEQEQKGQPMRLSGSREQAEQVKKVLEARKRGKKLIVTNPVIR